MPWLHESTLFQFNTGHGILTQFVALVMVAAANKFNRAATITLVAFQAEDLPNYSQPTAAAELGECFVFPGFIDVVAVEMLTRNVATATGHAAHAFFEPVQAGHILLPVAADLTGCLARDCAFVFLIHIGTIFCFKELRF